MIDFPCLCGETFSVPPELAGTQFQCPACGLLVSVPTLDDLSHLDKDGTYTLDTKPAMQQPRVATRMLPADSFMESPRDAEEIPMQPDAPPPMTPRYDPFTGELIREMTVLPHVQSVAAKAGPRTQPLSRMKMRGAVEPPPPMSWLVGLGELLMAKNISILLLMTVFNGLLAFGLFFVLGIGAGLFFVVPVVMMMLCVGYYSIIVQETGPGEKEELPRPLREFEIKIDIFDPFVHFCAPAAICFSPAIIAWWKLQGVVNQSWIVGGLAVVGAFIFPAAFLTAALDGVIANFRPDRVAGVIVKSGLSYLPVPIAWSLGTILIANGMAALYNGFISLFSSYVEVHGIKSYFANNWVMGLAFIFLGLYFSYYACWQLGMVWRGHYSEFPWVAQRFDKEPPPLPPVKAIPKASTVPPSHGRSAT